MPQHIQQNHTGTPPDTEGCLQFTRDLRLLLRENYAKGVLDPVRTRMREHAERCPHCKALVGEIKDQAEHPEKATNKDEAEGLGTVAEEAFAFLAELIVANGEAFAEVAVGVLEGIMEGLGDL